MHAGSGTVRGVMVSDGGKESIGTSMKEGSSLRSGLSARRRRRAAPIAKNVATVRTRRRLIGATRARSSRNCLRRVA